MVVDPRLVILNRSLAVSLGLDPALLEKAGSFFAGNEIPRGAEPIAQAYAGHQFGHFNNLGDGRAILVGEHLTPSGQRFDVQWKGTGRTHYSRGGDGRAALGPMLREYIISEAMYALGIPTTRSLAVATTGEDVLRQEVLPGAVLMRIAASHIRVGTFQYAAGHQDMSALTALVDHTIARHFPELAGTATRYENFFRAVAERQAVLIAKWMHVGFIHGVMNTDNMALSGETIDYGPCAFMDAYDPATVFSSIDHRGRYAYGRQPHIAQWNLARLAETLLPLFHPDQKASIDLANEMLAEFDSHFQSHWLLGMRSKLGLFTSETEDGTLVQDFLDWMQAGMLDFTTTFRALSEVTAMMSPPFIGDTFLSWHIRWTQRLGRQPQSPPQVVEVMRAHNPSLIPRNHKVEEALEAAVVYGDLSVMHRLLAVLAQPYADDLPDAYSTPPPKGAAVYQTFCGT